MLKDEKENEIKQLFEKKWKDEFNFSPDDVKKYLNNYENIDYNHPDLLNIIKLFDYYQYNNKDSFIEHVGNMYKCDFNYIIENFDNIIENFDNIIEEEEKINFEKIKTFLLIENVYIYDSIFQNFININNNILNFMANNEKMIMNLTFERDYNQKTEISDSVIHLTFGHYYNQITEIPNSVTNLTFGYSYNQKIKIPNSITHLFFGWKYNQMTEIPKNISECNLRKDLIKNVD